MLSDLSSGYIAYNRENLYFSYHASTAQIQLANAHRPSTGLIIKKELNSFQRIPALNSYDPGSCNNTIHGQEVLVTDKSDEDVILICVRNKGVYQWKPLDGKFILVDLGYCLCSTLLLQVQVDLCWYCHT